MPIKFDIDADLGVIFSEATDDVGFTDFESFRDQLRAHPFLRAGLYHLADYRTAKVQITGEQARIIANWFIGSHKVEKIAYVAESAFPYIRMLMGWVGDSDNITIKVFKDMKSARAWLDLTPSE